MSAERVDHFAVWCDHCGRMLVASDGRAAWPIANLALKIARDSGWYTDPDGRCFCTPCSSFPAGHAFAAESGAKNEPARGPEQKP